MKHDPNQALKRYNNKKKQGFSTFDSISIDLVGIKAYIACSGAAWPSVWLGSILEMKTEEALLLTESPMRSALKGFTWRLVATFTTIVIVYCITGEQAKALQIGAIEFVAKFVVYYLHERAWVRITFGQGLPKSRKNVVCV